MLGMSCMFHPPGPPARFPHCLMTGSDTLWRAEVSCAAGKTLRIPVCSGARSLAPGRSLWHSMLAEIITSPGRQIPPLAPSSWATGTVEEQLLWLGLMGLKSLASHSNMTQGVLDNNICSCNLRFTLKSFMCHWRPWHRHSGHHRRIPHNDHGVCVWSTRMDPGSASSQHRETGARMYKFCLKWIPGKNKGRNLISHIYLEFRNLLFLVASTVSMKIQSFWTPAKSTVLLTDGQMEPFFLLCTDFEQPTSIREFWSLVRSTLEIKINYQNNMTFWRWELLYSLLWHHLGIWHWGGRHSDSWSDDRGQRSPRHQCGPVWGLLPVVRVTGPRWWRGDLVPYQILITISS